MKLKRKDVIYVMLAAVIFTITGLVAYGQLVGHKSASSSAGVSVEVVDPITLDLDQATLSAMNDPAKIRDYTVPVDLGTGIGNKAPFGPL